MNNFAPTYFQGLEVNPESEYDPKPYTYLYSPSTNMGALSANASLFNESISIDVDSDFLLLGWYIPEYTGPFQIQILDSTGYQLFSNFLNSGAISQASSDPTVFSPSHPFPAGGRLQINIVDLSGALNALQIAFVGMKLFRKAAR